MTDFMILIIVLFVFFGQGTLHYLPVFPSSLSGKKETSDAMMSADQPGPAPGSGRE